MKTRIQSLDGLRGVAAFAVVLYHYFFRYNELYGYDFISDHLFSWGHYGVELFFMISGFVIYFSASRSQVSVKNFVISRFFRLYPTYWVCLTITFFTVSLFGLEGRDVDFRTALINIVMFQNYLGVKSVDGVYWTLAIELSFYFWIGLALWTNQISKAVYIFTSICFVSVFTANSSYFELKIFNVLFFTYYLPFFVIGMAAYLIQSKLNLKQGYIGVLISILTLYLTRESGVFIASLICLGIFFSAILLDFKLFSSPVLRFLGLISYPLYLLHQNIGYITINLLKSYLFAEVLAVLVAILISVSLAWVTHIYVENKLTSNIRNRVGKVGWFSK